MGQQIARVKWRRCLTAFAVLVCLSMGASWADDDPNPPHPELGGGFLLFGSLELDFDPGDYQFLVYDCGDQYVQQAMSVLGVTNYTLRTAATGNHVTLQDLNTHDILIVGWNSGGDVSGLSPEVIDEGIKGRVLLTGHDADWHTANSRWEQPYAETFLAQAIGYVLQGGRTGLMAMGDYSGSFVWLPEGWGIEVTGGLTEENVSLITDDGDASGVFDGLTEANLSNWSNSFHNTFDAYGVGFTAFEMGQVGGVDRAITIAAMRHPYGFDFEKWDDVGDEECVDPEEEITYTIHWDNTGGLVLEDAFIIDWLPSGVSYPDGEWTFGYDPNASPPLVLYPPDPGV